VEENCSKTSPTRLTISSVHITASETPILPKVSEECKIQVSCDIDFGIVHGIKRVDPMVCYDTAARNKYSERAQAGTW
jgi:hypothetical protein